MEDDPFLIQVHAGFWVRRDGCGKRLAEPRLKMEQLVEPGAELGVDGGPGDRGRFGEGVKAPGKPDVKVQRHGPVPELLDRCFLEGHGMVSECPVENGIEDDLVLP